MKKLIIAMSFLSLFLGGCKDEPALPEATQIANFLATKSWQTQTTSEGLIYVIDTIGSGTSFPNKNSTVTVKYKGYLLDGSVFDESTSGLRISLQSVIQGWQLGIPKFKKGGKGKLIFPSSLGYGSQKAGDIPANSPLVFEIELVDFM